MTRNRRNFLKTAGVGVAGALVVSPGSNLARPVTPTEFLAATELSSQQDLLIESIISKTPGHFNLSAEQKEALKKEGRELLSSLFHKLVQQHFTEQDLGEIVQHLSQPAEKKWARFNVLALDSARSAFVGRVEAAIKKEKV